MFKLDTLKEDLKAELDRKNNKLKDTITEESRMYLIGCINTLMETLEKLEALS